MDLSRQCHAKSKQSQQQCRRPAILGGYVCHIHGGKTPSAVMSAEQRIRDLVVPALERITRTIGDDDNPHLALAAARDILDRAGYKATEKIQSDGRTVIEIEYVARSLELPDRGA